MAKLTSPSISITFIEKAASLIERGSRGIVALVLRDASVTETPDTYTVRDVSDVRQVYRTQTSSISKML